MISIKKFLLTSLMAWLVFIAIDFICHASLLTRLWQNNLSAVKSQEDLFNLIPVGYAGFLLLTLLVGYLYMSRFKEKPPNKEAANFSLIIGLLLSGSNLLSSISYVNIHTYIQITFHFVYLIEILAVVFIFNRSLYSDKLKKHAWQYTALLFTLVFLGILIQNLTK